MLSALIPSTRVPARTLLLLAVPVLWFDVIGPHRWWLLGAWSGLLGYGLRGLRARDVSLFGMFVLGALVAWHDEGHWFARLSLALKFALGSWMMSFAVTAFAHAREARASLALAALAGVWLMYPSGVGFGALVVSAYLGSELSQRSVLGRDVVVSPRAPRLLSFVAVAALAMEAARTLPGNALTWRDSGGRESPFSGFNFPWSSGRMQDVPSWLDWLLQAPFVLLGLLFTLGVGALVFAVVTVVRHARGGLAQAWRAPVADDVHSTDRVENAPDGVRRLYERFLTVMAARGVGRRADETPREFEQRLLSHFPHVRAEVRVLSDAYQTVRYGVVPSDEVFEKARHALAQLELKVGNPS